MEITQLHYIAVGAVLNFAGIMFVTYINIKSNKKHNAKTALEDLLEKKVNKTVCDPAMKRLGNQIDKIDVVNEKQDTCIRGLENGMNYLVGRSGGNWDQIKNTGLNLG